jgi:hypothetical protein
MLENAKHFETKASYLHCMAIYETSTSLTFFRPQMPTKLEHSLTQRTRGKASHVAVARYPRAADQKPTPRRRPTARPLRRDSPAVECLSGRPASWRAEQRKPPER